MPMLKDDELIGTLATLPPRSQVCSTTSRSTLLSNFAQQAVIAVENNRLLKELREGSLAATDRDRRCAKGNQPLDLRFADSA